MTTLAQNLGQIVGAFLGQKRGSANGFAPTDTNNKLPNSFLSSDVVIKDGVTGRIIADRVTVPTTYVHHLSDLPAVVAALALPGDVVLTLGAGDITMQAPEIVAALRGREQPDKGRDR